ncbi:MAG TPA: MutH/Sau3AI family endonuclease, partial [Massilibacterium sp.]|nr:MutH/Sau3AI family endonuclease [Massilibacterium sp.]
MKEFNTKEELLEYAKQAETLTFGEIDKYNRLSNKKLKGGLGQIIEESYFGYEINSNQAPDFEELGVELKVTPIKELKNGQISAKERLVLNIINYEV